MEEVKEKKPQVTLRSKSSMEILSELFGTFDAEPPLIIKKEKSEEVSKKHKKSKKKHKHKEKKQKKKDRKRKLSASSSNGSEIDLAKILIKQEKEASEKRIKIEGTSIEISLSGSQEEASNNKKPSQSRAIVEDTKTNSTSKNIVIADLKASSFMSADRFNNHSFTNTEDGEIAASDSEDDQTLSPSKKRKHKSSRTKAKVTDLRSKLNTKKHDKEPRREDDRSRERHRSRDHSKERHRSRDRYRDDRDDYRSRRGRDSGREEPYRSRDDRHDKWFMREHYRGHGDRDHYGRETSPSYIDKKKLLEIARKNAIQMMKSGSLPGALTLGPQAQEKVIAAIKAGGKTIEELTDFCKTLSKKEEIGDLSDLSDKGPSSDNDELFHHPFRIKDKRTSITMNIKNSVPLPIKSTQERSSELRMQFPVSSGQQHRKTENEWVPVVESKKSESKSTSSAMNSIPTPAVPLAIEAPPPPVPPPEPVPVVPAPVNAPPGPQAFPSSILEPLANIGSIVSQRLTAMRRLQENPNDVMALTQIYKSNEEMQSWAQSKQQPGQFTGTTGAQILSQAELSSGFQAWAKKDQLQCAAPLSGGMGMHLLQKMGWKPGEGLGKEKTGALEPLLLEVKLDKKGLLAIEEQPNNKKKLKLKPNAVQTVKTLEGKHPVSLLGEYASKKKLGAPQYILEFECGPDHKKNFLFKVQLDGVEYKPNVASANKKEAKAAAAAVCLHEIGLK